MLDPIDSLYFKLAVGSDRIKTETPVDIAARCPICGDSKHSKNKARLHLYEKNGKCFVNCFNECSCVNRTMTSFLRDYFPNLYDGYKKEKFGEQLKRLKEDEISGAISAADIFTRDSLKNLLDDKDDKNKTDSSDITDITDITDTTNVSRCSITPLILFELFCFEYNEQKITDYYKSRGLTYNPDVFGKSYNSGTALTIDGKSYPLYNFLIIPFYKDGKWFGFYSRSFDSHKFYTYMPSKNSGCKVWNLYNVDVSRTVYVFEGIFDALSAYEHGLDNVVACCGATLNSDILKQFNDVVFCLDNDRTGISNSIKYLKEGYKTVNWTNPYKDCNEMLKAGINVKSEITDNIVSGILGIVKLQSKL